MFPLFGEDEHVFISQQIGDCAVELTTRDEVILDLRIRNPGPTTHTLMAMTEVTIGSAQNYFDLVVITIGDRLGLRRA